MKFWVSGFGFRVAVYKIEEVFTLFSKWITDLNPTWLSFTDRDLGTRPDVKIPVKDVVNTETALRSRYPDTKEFPF